jgi:hypothetical protein
MIFTGEVEILLLLFYGLKCRASILLALQRLQNFRVRDTPKGVHTLAC